MTEIQVAPTTTDVRNARWAWYFKSPFGRGATVVLVLFVLITIAQLLHGDFQIAKPNFGIIFFLTLFPILIGFIGLNSPAVKRYTEAPVSYTLSDEGLDVRTQRAQANFRWSEISRAIETKSYFILAGAGALQILPKRDLSSEARTATRQLLSAKLAQRARMAAG